MELPPYIPELNHCNLFLWGFIKNKCYLIHLETIEEVEDANRDAVRSIDKAIIQRIYTTFKHRIEFCSTSNGGPLRRHCILIC